MSKDTHESERENGPCGMRPPALTASAESVLECTYVPERELYAEGSTKDFAVRVRLTREGLGRSARQPRAAHRHGMESKSVNDLDEVELIAKPEIDGRRA